MKIYPYLMITLAVILFVSCDKSNEKIEDDESLIFSVQYSGGWAMVDETFKINSGATHFFSSYQDLETMKRKSSQTTIRTSKEQWEHLTKTFDLKTFDKINDGSCRACVDGVDETFSVIINGKTYSFYNGVVDEYYQQLQEFFDSIYDQIEDFRNKAVYR